MPTAPKTTEKTEEEKVDELIEAVDPPVLRREQHIIAGPNSRYPGFNAIYVQQKLSFFAKLDFIRVMSKAVSKAMGGTDDSLDLGELREGVSLENTDNAEVFIKAIARLAEHAPEIIEDLYMIALNVPSGQRPMVAEIMREPSEDDGSGGLTDDDGFDILHTFVEQNGKVMRDFFLEKMPKLGTALSGVFAAPESTPAPSKPSKRSARSTR